MIRPAQIRDARAIAEIQVASWRATYVGQVPEDYLAALSVETREGAWRECIERYEGSILVSVNIEIVQGFVNFGPCRDGESAARLGEIYAIYLSPSNLRCGIGARLWCSAIDALTIQKFDAATVWVLDSNLSARAFYEKMGCHLDGGEKSETIGSQKVVVLRYRTSLNCT
jgi:ribosomal protein S18 acetylase RimI-like enzyme